MRQFLLMLFVFGMLVGVGCESDFEDDALVTQRASLVQTFAPGSFVIPMDTTHQDQGMLKAFGLVYRLLSNGVPVHWVIDEAKTQGGADFTATTVDFQTSVPQTHGYRGGPFVIDATDAAAALPIIQSWHADGHVTRVHESTIGFSANVSKTLVSAPSIAVFQDGSEVIAFRYLNAAAIPDSLGQAWPSSTSTVYPGSPDVLTEAQLSGAAGIDDGVLLGSAAPAFCHLSSMHYDSTSVNDEVVREVRRFLEANSNSHAFMKCDSIESFENNVNGRFLSTQGLSDAGVNPNPIVSQAPADPLVQFDGGFTSVSGSIRSFELATGSAYHAAGQSLLVSQAAPSTVVYLSGHIDGDPTQGQVTYLGGHEYSTGLPISINPSTNGVRLYLNSLFDSPCTQVALPSVSITSPATSSVNDNSPEISGSVDVGATVSVAIRDAQGSIVFSGDASVTGGAWTIESGVLVDGDYTITATATDGGSASVSIGLTVDTEAPDISIDVPVAGATSTNPEVVLSGTAEEDAVVSVEVLDAQGQVIFSGTASRSAGDWSLTTDALPNGTFTVVATATDAASNTTSTPSREFGVNQPGPTLMVRSPEDGESFSSGTLAVSGFTTADEVDVVVRDEEGNIVNELTLVRNADGDFVGEVSGLEDGEYSLTFEAGEGADSTTVTTTIFVDTVAPVTSITSPSPNERVYTGDIKVEGTADPGQEVDVFLDSVFFGTVTANADGDWSLEIRVTEGVHVVEAVVTDEAGNAGTSGNITFEFKQPSDLLITRPANRAQVSGPTITLEGRGEPGAQVTIELDGESVVVEIDAQGNWTSTLDVLPGDRTIFVTDEFGQTAQITLDVEEGTGSVPDPDPDPDAAPEDPNTRLTGGGCAQAPGSRPPVEVLLVFLGWVGIGLRRKVRLF